MMGLQEIIDANNAVGADESAEERDVEVGRRLVRSAQRSEFLIGVLREIATSEDPDFDAQGVAITALLAVAVVDDVPGARELVEQLVKAVNDDEAPDECACEERAAA